MKRFIPAVSFALTLIVATAHANPTLEKDGIMTSKDGRTLYTFDSDAPGKSNCHGGCAAAWPIFSVANAALADADFSIIKRDDGAQQWAYKGMPLYFFAGDAKSGDMNGDGKNGWHVLRSTAKTAAVNKPTGTGTAKASDY